MIAIGATVPFLTDALAYFQFVFAAITPILMLGSVLGRFNFKAWIPFVLIWTRRVLGQRVLIWGGGFFALTVPWTTPVVT